MYGIINRLFRTSLLITAFLYFLMLLAVVSIIALKSAFKTSLQEEFATKQPHIKIKYITLSNNYKKDLEYIKSLSSKIASISPFVEGSKFFMATGYKEIGGNSLYSGDIKIIGIGTKNFVYDFFNASFMPRGKFNYPYTPLEFIYAFRTQKNLAVFNKALFNSFYPVIESTQNFEFKNKKIFKVKLGAVFEDYDKTPILYTNITFANKLLSQNPNQIDGFFVNAKKLNDIDSLTKLLRLKLPSDKFIVSSYLELRKKQFSLFKIYEILSLLIVMVILTLSSLFILLLLYNAIVKKSYQLSVLFTIGYNLKTKIFFVLFLTISFVTLLASFLIYKYLPLLIKSFNLPFRSFMLTNSFYTVFVLDIIFLAISYILIHNAYNLKAKSLFS